MPSLLSFFLAQIVYIISKSSFNGASNSSPTSMVGRFIKVITGCSSWTLYNHILNIIVPKEIMKNIHGKDGVK